MMQKLSENILDKFSMDFLRNQVLKNAYGNDDTIIAVRDPRILLVWYLFFGLVPWFVNDLPFLLGCFVLVTVTTLLARVAGLVLLLFAVGVFTQTGYLLAATIPVWRRRFRHRAASGTYAEGRHGIAGVGDGIFRTWIRIVSPMGLCGLAARSGFPSPYPMPTDAADADGRISKRTAFLPPAG